MIFRVPFITGLVVVLLSSTGPTMAREYKIESEIFGRKARDITVGPDLFKPHTRVFRKDDAVVGFLMEQL